MEVTYRMSTGDRCRCSLYVSTRQPSMAVMHLTNLILLTVLILLMISKHSAHPLTVSTAILPILLSLCGYVTYNVVVLFLVNSMRSRYASPQRMSTTSISPEGVHDVTQMTDVLLHWNTIKAIRYHHGDLFFWKILGGIVVPRSAFQGTNEAQYFYQSAVDFWRGNTSDQVEQPTTAIAMRGNNKDSLQIKPTDSPLSPMIRAMFTGELKPGEQILWHGHPFSDYGHILANEFALEALGMAVVVTSVITVGSDDWTPWLYSLVFWTLLAVIYFLGDWFCKKDGRKFDLQKYGSEKFDYLITDRSVLKRRKNGIHPPTFTSIEFAQIEYVKYEKPDVSVGAIEVGKSNTDSVLLKDIDNVSETADSLNAARGQQAFDLADIFTSRFSYDPFQRVLHPGETILWQGQPDRSKYQRVFWRKWEGLDYPLILGWLIGLAAWDFARLEPLGLQIAKITPFVLFTIWRFVYDFWKCESKALNLFYAVTNERLLLLDWSKSSIFAEADLSKIQSIKFDVFKSGIATFSFGGKTLDALSFEFVRNAQIVRTIINDARANLSESEIEWVDAAGERTKLRKEIRGRRIATVVLLLMFLGPLSVFLPVSYFYIRYYNPGMRHFQRGEYEAATDDFRVATHATADEQMYYDLGICLMRQKRYGEARPALLEASRQALAEDKPDSETDAEAKAMIAQIDAIQAHPSSKNSPR